MAPRAAQHAAGWGVGAMAHPAAQPRPAPQSAHTLQRGGENEKKGEGEEDGEAVRQFGRAALAGSPARERGHSSGRNRLQMAHQEP